MKGSQKITESTAIIIVTASTPVYERGIFLHVS